MDFGYACTSVLVADCSPARTVTLGRLRPLGSDADRHRVLADLARSNLRNTRRLFWHNIAHGLRLYRLTSNLVPFATHPVAAGWDWAAELAPEFGELRAIAAEYDLLLSSHPGAYTVLSTVHGAVRAAAVADLVYHARCMELLGLGPAGRMIIHVGGAQGGKAAALERFITAFAGLPPAVQERLCVENDDKVFHATDVLGLCHKLGVPMVLDLHHDTVNPGEAPVGALLDAIFATWAGARRPPKVHFSSPRSEREPRAHADGIDPAQFQAFVHRLDGRRCDVMVEAKAKDQALLALLDGLGIEHPRLQPAAASAGPRSPGAPAATGRGPAEG